MTFSEWHLRGREQPYNQSMGPLRRAALFLTIACLSLPGQVATVFVVVRPDFVSQKVDPAFTPEALRAGLIANAAFDVWVDENGIPTQLKLVYWSNVNRDNPDRLGLDRVAMTALRKWRFNPVIVSGKTVPFQIRIGLLLHPKGLTFTTSSPEPLSE